MTDVKQAFERVDMAIRDMPRQPLQWTEAEDEILVRGWNKIERGVLLQILNDYQRTNQLKIRSEDAIGARMGRLQRKLKP